MPLLAATKAGNARSKGSNFVTPGSRQSLHLTAVAAVAGATFAGVVLTSARANALEGEWHAGARLGVATLSGRSLGPAFDVHGAYELSDMFENRRRRHRIRLTPVLRERTCYRRPPASRTGLTCSSGSRT